MDIEPTPPATGQLHKKLARIKDLLASLPPDNAADQPHLAERSHPSFRYPYAPNPCLPAADLAAWEAANGVTLPEAYRLFLLDIGNGGILPCSYSRFDLWPLDKGSVAARLREPFLITRERFAQRMAIPLRERKGDEYLFPELRQYADEEVPPGCLKVARYPSWERVFLVVTGELRGTVWNIVEWETPEVDPHEQPFDFLGWLEEALLEMLEPM